MLLVNSLEFCGMTSVVLQWRMQVFDLSMTEGYGCDGVAICATPQCVIVRVC